MRAPRSFAATKDEARAELERLFTSKENLVFVDTPSEGSERGRLTEEIKKNAETVIPEIGGTTQVVFDNAIFRFAGILNY